MKTPYLLSVFMILALPLPGWTAEDPGQKQRQEELDRLKVQIQVLETQNRQMQQTLELLKTKLGEMSGTPVPPTIAPPAPVAAPAPAPLIPKAFQIGKSTTVSLYGFLRVDGIVDRSQMDRTHVPMYVRSEDPGAPAAVRARNNEPAFSMDPRLTRIGFDFDGGTPQPLGYAKLTGKLETDFDTVNSGPSSESRQLPRIRLAYLRMAWPEDLTVTLGQQWDVISPLLPGVQAHSVLWNVGNLGDRRPQATVSYDPVLGPGRLSMTGSLGLAGAVDNADLDANSTLDGAQSGMPMLQGRLGYARPLWVEKKDASLGIWGHNAQYSSATAIGLAGQNRFHGESYGMDLTLPMTQKLSFKGEAWQGRNLPDVRGGITQGVNGFGKVIASEGGWSELTYKFSDRYALLVGYAIDNPSDGDILDQAGGRTKNRVWYLGHKWTFGAMEFGVEYLNWVTDYKGLQSGENDRFNFYSQFNF